MDQTVANRSGGRPSLKRAAEMRQAIVTATIDVFAAHGIDFSMDQVAAAAAISKQAIYRRWPSKTDLLVDAIDAQVQSLSLAAVSSSRDAQMAPWEALHATAQRVFGDGGRNQKWARFSILLQAGSLRDPALIDRIVHWRREMLAIYAGLLRPLAPAGKEGDQLADDLAGILQDLLTGAGVTCFWDDRPGDRAAEIFQSRWQAFAAIAAVRGVTASA